MKISHFLRRAIVVTLYAIAMAYLESAVVVYLQRALSMTPKTLFPLRSHEILGTLGTIEVGREIATLVMLITVGWLAGETRLERLAWTSVAFGIWDIGYYFFLWLFIGWPTSFGRYDLLFLLPVPWVSPVWAPITVSGALIIFGLLVARRVRAGDRVFLRLRDLALMCVGGIVVIISFTLHFRSILNGAVPHSFAWPLFLLGMAMAVLGVAPLCKSAESVSI